MFFNFPFRSKDAQRRSKKEPPSLSEPVDNCARLHDCNSDAASVATTSCASEQHWSSHSASFASSFNSLACDDDLSKETEFVADLNQAVSKEGTTRRAQVLEDAGNGGAEFFECAGNGVSCCLADLDAARNKWIRCVASTRLETHPWCWDSRDNEVDSCHSQPWAFGTACMRRSLST